MSGRKKIEGWFEGFNKYTLALIVLITAIIGFIGLFWEQPRLFIIAMVVIALIIIVAGCTFVLIAEKDVNIVMGKEKSPAYPQYHAIAWIGLGVVVIIGVGVLVINPSRSFVVSAITNAPTRAFRPKDDGEILIIIAPFDDTGIGDTRLSIQLDTRIAERLSDELEQITTLSHVKIKRYPTAIKEAESVADIEYIQSTYNPSIILWGWYDSLGATAKYELSQENIYVSTDFDYEPSFTHIIRSSSDPDAFTLHINEDMPQEATHLVFFTIAQIFIIEQNYDDAVIYMNKAINTAPDGITESEKNILWGQLVMLYMLHDNLVAARRLTDHLIQETPSNTTARALRAQIYSIRSVFEYASNKDDMIITLNIDSVDGELMTVISSYKLIPPEAFGSLEAFCDYTYILENHTYEWSGKHKIYYFRGIQNYAAGNIRDAISDMRMATIGGLSDNVQNQAETYIDDWSLELSRIPQDLESLLKSTIICSSP